MNFKTQLNRLCIAALIIVLGCTKSETGPSGLTSLVKITQEAAGSNCANGGFKIETGVDTNKNSVLDSNEIQNTAYICNGANGSGTSGTNGSNGLTSLIKVTAESAGANCANGGYRIDTGIDDNADGTLEANEIDNTIYVCNGSGGSLVNYGKPILVLTDDVTDEEAAAIIASDLGIATQEIKIYNTNKLTTVDLSASDIDVISVDIHDNGVLKTLNLSGIKSVMGERLNVENCPVLETLNLNGVTSIVGGLDIENCPVLQTLNLDALEYLSMLYDDLYSSDGECRIDGTQLTQLSFPKLVKIGGEYELRLGSGNYGNTQLQSISFPELTTVMSGIIISGAPELTTLTLSTLTQVGTGYNSSGYVNFSINGKLSSASVNAILANFTQITPAITGASIYLQMTPAAPPTGQGITDKATLVANGNYVTTD